MRADRNRRLYERRAVAARYATRLGLHPDESAILERRRSDIAGQRILDIGVGGGRTTSALLQLSSDYIGIDYSKSMIERSRRRFPGVSFQLVDARDLSAFPDGSFDFVLFSFNGIDAVGHEDRLRVLREVHRVLDAGGLFAFSSHNRNYRIPKPWDVRHLALNPLREPLRFAKRAAWYPTGIVNYLRVAHGSQDHADYCLSVDPAFRYSLIHYQITAAAQERQLEHAGFRLVETVGCDGRRLLPGDRESSQDPWLQYICRLSIPAD